MPDIKSSGLSTDKAGRAAEIKKMYADLSAQAEEEGQEPELENNSMPQARVAPKRSKGGKILLTLFLVVVLAAVALLIISKTTNWNILGLPKTSEVGHINQPIAKASDWQAVFLTNGQVYFGKLKNVNDTYPVLEDIYYLQVQNVPIQPAQAASEEGGVQPAQQTQQKLVLIKFGTELHRPMDKMYINRDHILFFEDMSQESNVVKAIENYKAGK